jgi:hypothetical protein
MGGKKSQNSRELSKNALYSPIGSKEGKNQEKWTKLGLQ